MISVDKMSDEQLEHHALDILCRELGLHGFARFLRVYRADPGNYTSERHQWLQSATVSDLEREFNEKR